jgi:hypothetical protein
MQNAESPKSGHETAEVGCSFCVPLPRNGAAEPRRIKPPPPPELAGMVFTPTPPEMAEEFRRTFDEEEYLAAARDVEQTGGVTFAEISAEIEHKLHGRN